jgi:hypothetical protein
MPILITRNRRTPMKLPDRLHCPNCKGRLVSAPTAVFADALRCADCERAIQIIDGIGDFAGDPLEAMGNADRYMGNLRLNETGAIGLLAQIQAAAGDRWPGFLGDTIEFGCGRGEMTHALAAAQGMRSLASRRLVSVPIDRSVTQRSAETGMRSVTRWPIQWWESACCPGSATYARSWLWCIAS